MYFPRGGGKPRSKMEMVIPPGSLIPSNKTKNFKDQPTVCRYAFVMYAHCWI